MSTRLYVLLAAISFATWIGMPDPVAAAKQKGQPGQCIFQKCHAKCVAKGGNHRTPEAQCAKRCAKRGCV